MNGVPSRVPAQRTPHSGTTSDQAMRSGQSAIDEYQSWRKQFLLPRMEGRARTSTAQ